MADFHDPTGSPWGDQGPGSGRWDLHGGGALQGPPPGLGEIVWEGEGWAQCASLGFACPGRGGQRNSSPSPPPRRSDAVLSPAGLAYSNLVYDWVKAAVLFGVVNTVARLDHLDPPQPPKCITALYMFADT